MNGNCSRLWELPFISIAVWHFIFFVVYSKGFPKLFILIRSCWPSVSGSWRLVAREKVGLCKKGNKTNIKSVKIHLALLVIPRIIALVCIKTVSKCQHDIFWLKDNNRLPSSFLIHGESFSSPPPTLWTFLYKTLALFGFGSLSNLNYANPHSKIMSVP